LEQNWLALHVYLRRSKRTRILIKSGSKVLVVRGWLSDDRWQLPGGGLHKNEDPLVGILRELKEETSITLDKSQLKKSGSKSQQSELLHFDYELFTARMQQITQPQLKGLELTHADWIDAESLNLGNAQRHVIDALMTK